MAASAGAPSVAPPGAVPPARSAPSSSPSRRPPSPPPGRHGPARPRESAVDAPPNAGVDGRRPSSSPWLSVAGRRPKHARLENGPGLRPLPLEGAAASAPSAAAAAAAAAAARASTTAAHEAPGRRRLAERGQTPPLPGASRPVAPPRIGLRAAVGRPPGAAPAPAPAPKLVLVKPVIHRRAGIGAPHAVHAAALMADVRAGRTLAPGAAAATAPPAPSPTPAIAFRSAQDAAAVPETAPPQDDAAAVAVFDDAEATQRLRQGKGAAWLRAQGWALQPTLTAPSAAPGAPAATATATATATASATAPPPPLRASVAEAALPQEPSGAPAAAFPRAITAWQLDAMQRYSLRRSASGLGLVGEGSGLSAAGSASGSRVDLAADAVDAVDEAVAAAMASTETVDPWAQRDRFL
ncbi:hypothetical protein CXG81DRAFT_25419 [Caulochytrium protostelioides]|uniref:Uncharacterized protein n=1 Tax=Caulochytrium protostelioides TaxID=1555241 RepID=A0A4V1IUW0_9FUNG|nr:hypothetical protein CXG81DRAFT_25419 [Caulochytrium protostelioides]|eukprot:RKP01929.1 hypothetical protein CXG81DRAFT_25419 [Caulochytrium protostelioides]